MNKSIEDEELYLKNIDFEAAGIKPIKHPAIAKLQADTQAYQLIDPAVLHWLSLQNQSTRDRINDLLKSFMQISLELKS